MMTVTQKLKETLDSPKLFLIVMSIIWVEIKLGYLSSFSFLNLHPPPFPLPLSLSVTLSQGL